MSDFFEQVQQQANRLHGVRNDVSEGESVGEVGMEKMVKNSSKLPANAQGFRRWSSDDQKFWGCKETHDNLPAGVYRAMASPQIGYYLEKQKIDTDELLVLPDTASEEVVKEIDTFWSLKPEFEKRGFIHKRGILMWGDPGSGKTSTIQLIIKQVVENGNVALMADDPRVLAGCLQMIRRIEPNRPLIVFLEDIDALIKQHGESEFLALLDGEAQVNNVVFIATTNYPELIDKRFIDRPSRFDTVKFVPFPSAAARKLYLTTKEPTLEGAELEQWVKLSKGFSVAHLKEMIISNRCYNKPIEEVVERLSKMNERKYTSDDARTRKTKLGFGRTAMPSTDED